MTTPHLNPLPVWQIATDGAHNPVLGVSTWAWVDHTGRHRSGTVPHHYPANPLSAELCAIDDALTHAPTHCPVVVLVDSKDALRVIHRSKPPHKRHRSLLARIRRSLDARPPQTRAEVTYVQGHSGHPLNEAADQLAVATRRSYENPTAPPHTGTGAASGWAA